MMGDGSLMKDSDMPMLLAAVPADAHVMRDGSIMKNIAMPSLFATDQLDVVVPEMPSLLAKIDFATHSTPESFIQAMTSTGQTEAQCRAFATDTISGISAGVTSEQGVLDAVDTGATCAQMGQSAVGRRLLTGTAQANLDAAQAALLAAQAACAAATTAETAACSASVTLSVNLGTLTGSQCYDYTSETSYTSVKAACDSATDAKNIACAAVPVAEDAVADAEEALAGAVAEAARLKKECHCRVQAEQAAAWTAAQAATASHAADWKQAHEILCALDQSAAAGSGQDECEIPTLAEVTQPTLAAGVADEDCTCTNQEVISYVEHAEQACHGRNEIWVGSASLAACKQRCTNAPACVSIEMHGSSSCRVSNSCQGSYIVPYGNHDVWVQERNTVCQ